MWWNHQNLDKPRKDKSGKRWNFRVWHEVLNGRHVECVFFWDDEKESCGAVRLARNHECSNGRTRRSECQTQLQQERYL